jgi:cold shock CspA family protein
MTGRITKIIRAGGCGFIRAPSGQEVFFHKSDLQGTKYGELDASVDVEFDLVADSISGPRAVRVRLGRQARPGRSHGSSTRHD